MEVVRDTIRHNSWATCRLIEHMQSLPPEALHLSGPGTYGQIGATLSHLLRAEAAYLARLQGTSPQLPPPGPIELEQLAAEAQRLRLDWEHLVETGLDPAVSVKTMRGMRRAGTILAQAINHGAEHRAQVCTVLGAHGLEPPPLDPFAYEEATGHDEAPPG